MRLTGFLSMLQWGQNSLILAAQYNNSKIIDIIFTRFPNTDVNISAQNGKSALMWAAENANEQIFEKLTTTRQV